MAAGAQENLFLAGAIETSEGLFNHRHCFGRVLVHLDENFCRKICLSPMIVRLVL